MATHSLVFMPEKSHGQRSLVDYNPCNTREDSTHGHPQMVNAEIRLQPKMEKLYTVSRRRQWQPTPVLLPGKSYG